MCDKHTITVPRDWRRSVQRQGLAVRDGLMTLAAQPLPSPHADVRLYQAVWASQGRWYQVHTHRGVIAVAGGLSYHGADARAALAGLRRKARAAATDQSPDTKVARFVARMRRYIGRGVRVSVQHARDTGSCESGIRSWCADVGLDFAAGSAPLGDVLNAYETCPLPEARRAILYAVGR